MSVEVTNPKPWGEQTNIPLSVSAGGTGCTTAEQVIEAFSLEKAKYAGSASHAVPLNERGEIEDKYLGGVVELRARVSGDTYIQASETKEYFLTTYDCFTNYDVVAINGEVSRDGAIITYTAGDVAGQGGFSVNGYLCLIEIQGFAIARPSIVFPRDFFTFSESSSQSLAIVSSGFHNSGEGNHVSTDWELAYDEIFSSIAKRSLGDSKNLTEWFVDTLRANSTYYVRCRYHGSENEISDWSDAVSINISGSVARPLAAATLTFGSPTVNHGFGYNATMNSDGTVAAVASTDNWGDKKGRIYIYSRTGATWSLVQTIPLPAGMAAEVNYGVALAMSGNVNGASSAGLLLVGADSEDTGGDARGCVYTYRKSSSSNGSWYHYSTIRAADASNGDGFGNAVAINHDATRAIVGALCDDDKGTNAGSMYYYTIENDITWNQINKFYAQDSQSGQTFGTSAAMNQDGTLCVVGANRDSVNGTNSGSAYVFELVNEVWKQVTKIVPADGKADDVFGSVVAMAGDSSILNGNLILIASPSNDDLVPGNSGLINAGKVYIYGRIQVGVNQWKLLEKVYPIVSVIQPNINFGTALAIDQLGNNILIGSPGMDLLTAADNYGQLDYYTL